MSEEKVDFESYLDPDETIVWTGRPERVKKTVREALKASEGFIMGWTLALGLTIAAGNSGLGMLQAAESWQQGRFGFGLLLTLVALLILYTAVQMTLSNYRDQKTLSLERYALTDKRALCWMQFGRSFLVRSIPIMKGDWIGAELRVPGRILFSRATIALSDEGEPLPEEDFVVFSDIPDAAEAYRIIRSIQNGDTCPSPSPTPA